jgi:hypothetical protein
LAKGRSPTLASHSSPSPHLPPFPSLSPPQKLDLEEPNKALSNERMFLTWLRLSVFMGGISVMMLGFAAKVSGWFLGSGASREFVAVAMPHHSPHLLSHHSPHALSPPLSPSGVFGPRRAPHHPHQRGHGVRSHGLRHLHLRAWNQRLPVARVSRAGRRDEQGRKDRGEPFLLNTHFLSLPLAYVPTQPLSPLTRTHPTHTSHTPSSSQHPPLPVPSRALR